MIFENISEMSSILSSIWRAREKAKEGREHILTSMNPNGSRGCATLIDIYRAIVSAGLSPILRAA